MASRRESTGPSAAFRFERCKATSASQLPYRTGQEAPGLSPLAAPRSPMVLSCFVVIVSWRLATPLRGLKRDCAKALSTRMKQWASRRPPASKGVAQIAFRKSRPDQHIRLREADESRAIPRA